MDAVQIIEVTGNDWIPVLIDPDSDGYTEMLVEKIEVERAIMWTSVVITDPLVITPFIPYQSRFDYNIYLKRHKEAPLDSYRYSITRY